jgi:hypothetical protein
LAAQQVTAEVVDDGERVAVLAVAEELPFEIDGPNLIGCGGVEGSRSGMLPAPLTSPRAEPAVAFENIEDGAACGQGPARKTFFGVAPRSFVRPIRIESSPRESA